MSDAGVVSVTGGKLTTYREMAQDTIDMVVRRLDRRERCRTKNLKLFGASGYRELAVSDPYFHLSSRFGTAAGEVRALIEEDSSLGEPLVPGLPYVAAEAVYATRLEMATTLDDVLTRRTRAHLEDRAATISAAPAIAELIAPELGWDSDETGRQVEQYMALCDAEISAAQTPESTASTEADT